MVERINRPEYMKRLIEYKDKDVVKIVTGIRRSGKSTLLDLFEDYLLEICRGKAIRKTVRPNHGINVGRNRQGARVSSAERDKGQL